MAIVCLWCIIYFLYSMHVHLMTRAKRVRVSRRHLHSFLWIGSFTSLPGLKLSFEMACTWWWWWWWWWCWCWCVCVCVCVCVCSQCHVIRSRIRKVYVCLAVTFHLHLLHRDILFYFCIVVTVVVTRGWNEYRVSKEADPREEKSLAALTGTRTRDLWIASWSLYHGQKTRTHYGVTFCDKNSSTTSSSLYISEDSSSRKVGCGWDVDWFFYLFTRP